MAHFIHRDNRLIFEHGAVEGLDAFVMKNIVARQHRHDAGNFQRFGNIDAFDARVRIRAAQDLAVTHARNAHVGQVVRFAGYFGFVIQPANVLPISLVPFVEFSRSFTLERSEFQSSRDQPHVLHRLHDFLIATAAAKISAR